MIIIDKNIKIKDLDERLNLFWKLSGEKINLIEREYDTCNGAPVFTIEGKYTSRGWTEWTQGFQYGSALLQFDASGDELFLKIGRDNTVEKMAPHLSHIGVHDHGFNNLSTYGNLLRLMNDGKIPYNKWEEAFYKLAIKVSGSVQAARWSPFPNGGGYIYSFNGPHSLFVDTIRSCRIVMCAHLLGHTFQGENDKVISLLGRALSHIESTAKYAVFYGEGRDAYDEWGRTAHESLFNINDGNYRCPNSQQGYSGFTTWTRGLAWAMLGFAEELELILSLSHEELQPFGGKDYLANMIEKGARATCDFFIKNTPTDGITYWDTGAPNLHQLGDYLNREADPFNDFEPVDSSASAIGAQGLLRLGKILGDNTYTQAGLTTARTLLSPVYLSENSAHQGLLLHTIYHQPNGWDHVPVGRNVAFGESCMWGDYHIRELMLYITKQLKQEPYYTFYNCIK